MAMRGFPLAPVDPGHRPARTVNASFDNDGVSFCACESGPLRCL